ncbi:cold-shock protein [Mangrovibacterium diazotrophicum]|uniref:Uncharacterized protein n=1 Tax=Mangrovibacterium diazotrophicum TaxID=1261403 RepID=A0A419W4S4_9BACT|nr:hypothetical protein [Mangrovibacterium diazotrophicum]RKD90436.1 hypothetical protein BC643_0775 [Mangrovibacterium diazotrophicum]
METKVQLGTVVFWRHTFGFIAIEDLSLAYFFHRSSLRDPNQHVELLDQFEFEIAETDTGKFKGKARAINLRFVEKGRVDDPRFDRYVGTLKSWNKGIGHITTEQLIETSEVYVNTSRILGERPHLSQGELLVFCPVQSAKSPSNILALFAYPVDSENDLSFLKQQYFETRIPELGNYLLKQSELTDIDLQIIELFSIERIEGRNIEGYAKLKEDLKRIKAQFGYLPPYKDLLIFADEGFLLQLFIEGIIPDFRYEDVLHYFLNTTSIQKKEILFRLNQDDQQQIIKEYLNWIKIYVDLNSIGNEIKCYLDITHRDKNLKDEAAYQGLAEILLTTLPVSEVKKLWIKKYIELPQKFIKDNFDLSNPYEIITLLDSEDESQKQIAIRLLNEQILEVTEGEILKNYTYYVGWLKFIQIHNSRLFHKEFTEALNALPIQDKYCLWIFDILPSIDYTAIPPFVFEQCDYYLRLRSATKDQYFSFLTNHIEQNELNDFIQQYAWNELVQPCFPKSDTTYSLLVDICDWQKKYQNNTIEIDPLAECVYHSIPKFTVQHVRLWLYDFVSPEYLDYYGFREAFKKLNNPEKVEFRNKANWHSKLELDEEAKLTVEPCTNFTETEDGEIIYKARLNNIYFTNGYLALRLEDRSYTQRFYAPEVSTGLNSISEFSNLIDREITILVREKQIQKVDDNLYIILSEVFRNYLLKALATPIAKNKKSKRSYAYAENMELRKQVLNYLKIIQTPDKKTVILDEPHAYYRRLDESVEFPDVEKVALYSIKTSDGYAIIWENIDYSFDRASFVFKTTDESYGNLVEKLTLAITRLGQLRSTLRKLDPDINELHEFKNSLGYVGTVLKKRGQNDAFESWKNNLTETINRKIPPQTDRLFDEIWRELNIDSTKSVRHTNPLPDKKGIKTVDTGEDNSSTKEETIVTERNDQPPGQTSSFSNQSPYKEREAVLSALNEINNLFENLLKMKE